LFSGILETLCDVLVKSDLPWWALERWIVWTERKVKKLKRETHRERICDFHKQQVFIRERRPERAPRPSE
jgi:hypothetical protein